VYVVENDTVAAVSGADIKSAIHLTVLDGAELGYKVTDAVFTNKINTTSILK